MVIVESEIVRRLLAAEDPDTVLIVHCGRCALVTEQEATAALVVARRRELPAEFLEPGLTDARFAHLTTCLDNTARDLGFT